MIALHQNVAHVHGDDVVVVLQHVVVVAGPLDHGPDQNLVSPRWTKPNVFFLIGVCP